MIPMIPNSISWGCRVSIFHLLHWLVHIPKVGKNIAAWRRGSPMFTCSLLAKILCETCDKIAKEATTNPRWTWLATCWNRYAELSHTASAPVLLKIALLWKPWGDAMQWNLGPGTQAWSTAWWLLGPGILVLDALICAAARNPIAHQLLSLLVLSCLSAEIIKHIYPG